MGGGSDEPQSAEQAWVYDCLRCSAWVCLLEQKVKDLYRTAEQCLAKECWAKFHIVLQFWVFCDFASTCARARVCVCVCMIECVCECMCVCVCVHAWAYVHEWVCVRARVCVCMQVCMGIYLCIWICFFFKNVSNWIHSLDEMIQLGSCETLFLSR